MPEMRGDIKEFVEIITPPADRSRRREFKPKKLRRYKKLIIPFIIAAVVIAADQISKYIVKTNLRLGDPQEFIKYILNFYRTENDGAAWSILRDHRWVFMSLSVIALVFMGAAIIYLGRKNFKKHNLWINISLSLMLGGGAGNMIDRLTNITAQPEILGENTKVVVDFIQFSFWKSFPIFNIADTFICIGSVLLCICIFSGKYKMPELPAFLRFKRKTNSSEDNQDNQNNQNNNI